MEASRNRLSRRELIVALASSPCWTGIWESWPRVLAAPAGSPPAAPAQEKNSSRQEADWKLERRLRTSSGGPEGPWTVSEEVVTWDPQRTAIIIVDMWNDHHCISASRRVAEMAPFMNGVIGTARSRGVLIIHSPSDCMDFYQGTPQRRTAQKAPFTAARVPFKWNSFDLAREGPLAAHLEGAGCSCDTVEPCGPDHRVWEREHPDLDIGAADAVTDSGQEVFNLLEARGIENVVIMGVHTNRCVLGRPFGIRQMVYLGKNVVLCRDLTDSYHRDPGRHFEGLRSIIQHIEKYWCPTISSASITGSAAFRFPGDSTSAE